MHTQLFSFLLLITISAHAQVKNYVPVLATDSQKDIIDKAANLIPSDRQFRWQQLELTAFFHFGINTFTNKEWGDGKEDISQFNPSELDAGQWVKTVKDAGFKQVIITAKHHDGFCLWPSKFTEHTVKNTPYKNGKGDIVKEVATACKKYNIGFGIYLSPWDRNSPFYGSDKYNTFFVNQLTELLTQYGRVDEVWFDGANGEGPDGKKQEYDFDNWYKLIRRLQPQATIAIMGSDVRWVGTESGRGRLTEWSVLPVNDGWKAKIDAGSQKDVAFAPNGDMMKDDMGSRAKLVGAKGLMWYPAETDVSIRPGWFYHPEQDTMVFSPDFFMDIYLSSVGRNSVLLLNVPPNKKGLIAEPDVKSLMGWRKKYNQTFAVNLARGAVVKSKNGINATTITDNKYSTYFITKGKDTTTVIELTLPQSRTFDVLLLQENIKVGQRVEKFKAEYFDGKEWKPFTEGTTIGYKRLLKFDAVTAKRVRLVIESSRLNPTLSEFGLYKMAG